MFWFKPLCCLVAPVCCTLELVDTLAAGFFQTRCSHDQLVGWPYHYRIFFSDDEFPEVCKGEMLVLSESGIFKEM